ERLEKEHAVPPAQERHERHPERAARADRHGDLGCRVGREVVFPGQLGGKGLAKAEIALRGGVLIGSVAHGLRRRLDQHLRRRKISKALPEVDAAHLAAPGGHHRGQGVLQRRDVCRYGEGHGSNQLRSAQLIGIARSSGKAMLAQWRRSLWRIADSSASGAGTVKLLLALAT